MSARVWIAAALALTFGSAPVIANAPEASLRPVLRPEPDTPNLVANAAVQVAAVEAAFTVKRTRPAPRPESEQVTRAAALVPGAPSFGPDTSLRPYLRPKEVEQQALFGRKKRRAMKDAVCGVPEIKGTKVGNVPGKIRGCGVKDAVRVTSVSDVRLSTPAVLTCDTAQALNTWVANSAKPAFRRRGKLVELKVAAHYVCRTRNHRSGAKISEHGKGKAIDISAFIMGDGKRITVLNGWNAGGSSSALRRVHKEACGPFGTVLGPNADRYHRDHFHFDTARHRGGNYCR